MRKTCRPPWEIAHLVGAILILIGLGIVVTIVGPTIISWITIAITNLMNGINAAITFITGGISAVCEIITHLLTTYQTYLLLAMLFIFSIIIGWIIEYMQNDSYVSRAFRLGFIWGLGSVIAISLDHLFRYQYLPTGETTSVMWFGEATSAPVYALTPTGPGLAFWIYVGIILAVVIGSTSGWIARWCKRCLIFGDREEEEDKGGKPPVPPTMRDGMQDPIEPKSTIVVKDGSMTIVKPEPDTKTILKNLGIVDPKYRSHWER